MPEVVVELCGIRRVFREQGSSLEVHAVDGIDLKIAKGEFLAIMGASGSGKSTLLHILGCLDRPTEGKYLLDGEDVSILNDDRLSQLRNTKIGFIFQTFNLIPQLNVIENVELPLLYSGQPIDQKRCIEVITAVGLEDRISFLPNRISGGEMQRVAIARALVNNPTLLVADEPTGNLDSKSSQDIMHIFEELHKTGRTIVVVTHEEEIARRAERIMHFSDGKIVREEKGFS
ncbi:MAG: ABC transporter ATP-binding protein [Planctomycetes bacterium]|nr:ABC transporter ATP-binding protein [Planctomycetota bacterium]